VKEKKVFIKSFGLNEFNRVDFPRKISNVQISRIEFGVQMGCSWCFPHGYETANATILKNRKNWKFKRMKQYNRSPSFDPTFIKNYGFYNFV